MTSLSERLTRTRVGRAFQAASEQLDVIVERDPSIRSRGEAALHSALPAILGYRVAHRLYLRGRYRTARAVFVLARMVTGVEIHPGARIGRRFFIDHGSGVVIGETSVIGDDVTLFHQVTLGATGWWKDESRGPGARRHPNLGNGVIIGANATLLGPITIGDNVLVGAQSLVLVDVPDEHVVRAPRADVRPVKPAGDLAGEATPRTPRRLRRERDNRILIVSPYPSSVRHAVDAGFEVYAVVDPARETAEHIAEVAADATEIHHADFADGPALRRLIETTARRVGVARVLAMGRWEDAHLPAAEVAWSLGLGLNPPESIRRVNDKVAMRRLLHEHGLSPVRSAVFGSPDQVALGGLVLPVIAKPAGLSASRGVMLIADAADLASWRAKLAGYRYSGPVILEEFLRGAEFSIETVSVDGEHHVLGITAKQVTPPPRFVETGHLHPAPLAEADRKAITELVTAFLAVADYRFGPAHTEVVLTDDGPRIVESQARLGGDRIPLLVRIATGVDIDAVVYQALTGKPVEEPIADRLGCVSFFELSPGTLRSVAPLADIARLPFVHEVDFPFAPGDVVPAFADSFTRHGHVVVHANSPEQARERVAQVQRLLAADIEPFGGNP